MDRVANTQEIGKRAYSQNRVWNNSMLNTVLIMTMRKRVQKINVESIGMAECLNPRNAPVVTSIVPSRT